MRLLSFCLSVRSVHLCVNICAVCVFVCECVCVYVSVCAPAHSWLISQVRSHTRQSHRGGRRTSGTAMAPNGSHGSPVALVLSASLPAQTAPASTQSRWEPVAWKALVGVYVCMCVCVCVCVCGGPSAVGPWC